MSKMVLALEIIQICNILYFKEWKKQNRYIK